MAEDRAAPTAPGPDSRGVGSGPRPFDRDLDLRAILAFAACLVLAMGAVLAVVWVLLGLLRHESMARDPRPSPLPEANEPRLPPEPRLQPSPSADLQSLRAEEEAVLGSYGWVDRAAGVGRIPIERAIAILTATGLQAAPEATPAPRSPAVAKPRHG